MVDPLSISTRIPSQEPVVASVQVGSLLAANLYSRVQFQASRVHSYVRQNFQAPQDQLTATVTATYLSTYPHRVASSRAQLTDNPGTRSSSQRSWNVIAEPRGLHTSLTCAGADCNLPPLSVGEIMKMPMSLRRAASTAGLLSRSE